MQQLELDFGSPPNLTVYEELGYYPSSFGRSVAWTQEQSIADYALGKMAEEMGETQYADHLLFRSQNWKNVYDPEIGFIHARDEQGNFEELVSESAWGDEYAEGNARQYLWLVPHAPEDLFDVLGGNTIALQRLNEMLIEMEKADGDTPGAPESWYWHGNEPGLHIPWLFALAGDPESTRQWTHWLMENRYSTLDDGLAGNDDGGTDGGGDDGGTDGGGNGDCGQGACGDGYIEDCSGDGDCCPETWIGDGFEDCEDQAWGCDLTCCDNDGGDCGSSTTGGTTGGGSGSCDSCEYDWTPYGSECCDTAWDEYGIDCATLEGVYYWDCSGCECPGDSESTSGGTTGGGGSGSCVGNCGSSSDTCWCDDQCEYYGDCCDDYYDECRDGVLGESYESTVERPIYSLDDFRERYIPYNSNRDFIEFKKSQGYNVEVLSYPDIATNQNELRDYLSDYNDSHPMLEYVLLVGDVTGAYTIPTHLIASYNDADYPLDQTDYPYTFFSDDQMYNPHFFIGRWSIQDQSELLAIISRTIGYSRLVHPITGDDLDTEYLNNALIVAGNFSGYEVPQNEWPTIPVNSSIAFDRAYPHRTSVALPNILSSSSLKGKLSFLPYTSELEVIKTLVLFLLARLRIRSVLSILFRNDSIGSCTTSFTPTDAARW